MNTASLFAHDRPTMRLPLDLAEWWWYRDVGDGRRYRQTVSSENRSSLPMARKICAIAQNDSTMLPRVGGGYCQEDQRLC